MSKLHIARAAVRIDGADEATVRQLGERMTTEKRYAASCVRGLADVQIHTDVLRGLLLDVSFLLELQETGQEDAVLFAVKMLGEGAHIKLDGNTYAENPTHTGTITLLTIGGPEAAARRIVQTFEPDDIVTLGNVHGHMLKGPVGVDEDGTYTLFGFRITDMLINEGWSVLHNGGGPQG